MVRTNDVLPDDLPSDKHLSSFDRNSQPIDRGGGAAILRTIAEAMRTVERKGAEATRGRRREASRAEKVDYAAQGYLPPEQFELYQIALAARANAEPDVVAPPAPTMPAEPAEPRVRRKMHRDNSIRKEINAYGAIPPDIAAELTPLATALLAKYMACAAFRKGFRKGEGFCSDANGTHAANLGCSERAIQDANAELEAKGVITILRRRGQFGRNDTNIVKLACKRLIGWVKSAWDRGGKGQKSSPLLRVSERFFWWLSGRSQLPTSKNREKKEGKRRAENGSKASCEGGLWQNVAPT